MFGANPKRPPVKDHDGKQLNVVDVFPTIQGEGPFAGRPAIFIRLGGCNLACDFCDTEFETFAPRPLADLFKQTKAFAADTVTLVVITGGEPLRQNIAPLCEGLIEQGFTVQIETNGTLYRPLPEAVQLVCSPKNTNGIYAPLRPDLLARVEALKFIISATHQDYQQLPNWCHDIDSTKCRIYVQPMDEYDAVKNAANQQRAIQLATKHNYVLSLQLHKILDIA